MMNIDVPGIGPVGAIALRNQPQKVWKHFYAPHEHWDALAAVDCGALYQAARALGCPARGPAHGPRGDIGPLNDPCKALLGRHHGEHYAPAYMAELAHPETQREPKRREPLKILCCTPRGVLVLVGTRAPVQVLTAYRPALPYEQVTRPRDMEYHREARRHWRWQTSLSAMTTWADDSAAELGELALGAPPETVADAWHLVITIGHARLLVAGNPGLGALGALLGPAEQHLHEHRDVIAGMLGPALRFAAVADAMDGALQEGASDAMSDSDELEELWLLAEDLLIAGTLLGLDEQCSQLLQRVAAAFGEARRPLAELLPLARERWLQVGDEHPAGALWEMIADDSSVADAYMRMVLDDTGRKEEEGDGHGGPAYVARRLWQQICCMAALTTLRSDSTLLPVARMWRTVPAPLLGPGAQLLADLWLRLSPVQGRDVRLFAIDAARPHGEDITDMLAAAGSGTDEAEMRVWQLRGPVDDVLLVVVAGPSPVPAAPLHELLDHAAGEPAWAVQSFHFTLPR